MREAFAAQEKAPTAHSLAKHRRERARVDAQSVYYPRARSDALPLLDDD